MNFKVFLSILIAFQFPVYAAAVDSVYNGPEERLLALERLNGGLLKQSATGCQTVCRKNPFSDSVTCEEVCSAPSANLCDRTPANVALLGCITGGLVGGLIGVGAGAAVTWGAVGCVGLGGTTYLLRATANCGQ